MSKRLPLLLAIGCALVLSLVWGYDGYRAWLGDMPGSDGLYRRSAFWTMTWTSLACGVVAGGTAVYAIRRWHRARREGASPSGAVLLTLGTAFVAVFGAGLGAMYNYTMATLPMVVVGRRTWGSTPQVLDHDAPCRMLVEEYGSAGVFARLAVELAALGAPPQLEERCIEAAEQELEHARFAVGLQGMDTVELAPWTPESRVPSRWRIGVENLFDGCLNEGIASLLAQREARRAPASDRRRWERLAREEAGHATLGRDVARWALAGRAELPRRSPRGEAVLSRLSTGQKLTATSSDGPVRRPV